MTGEAEPLEAEGVIARQNFTCCGSCGAIEIWDEIEEAIGVILGDIYYINIVTHILIAMERMRSEKLNVVRLAPIHSR